MTDTAAKSQPKYTAQLKKLLANPPEYKRSPSLEYIGRVVKDNYPESTIDTHLVYTETQYFDTEMRADCVHVHRDDELMVLSAIYENNVMMFTDYSVVKDTHTNPRTVFVKEFEETDEPNNKVLAEVTQLLIDWANYNHIVDQPDFIEESHPEFDEPDYGDDDDFGEDDAESSITFDADGNVIAVSHNGDCIYFV